MGELATTRIPEQFRELMARLAGLRFAPVDLETHWLGLHDLLLSDLETAVNRAARECADFPSPKQLRTFVAEQRAKPAPVPVTLDCREVPGAMTTFVVVAGVDVSITPTRVWQYYCDDCSDSGWLNHWCGSDALPKPWLVPRLCGHPRAHASHEWVRLCPCVERNPDVPAPVKQRARTQRETGSA